MIQTTKVFTSCPATRDRVTAQDHRTGTVPTGHFGGHEPEQPAQAMVKEPEKHLLDRAVEPGMKLVSNDEVKRVVELGSGTVRTDLR